MGTIDRAAQLLIYEPAGDLIIFEFGMTALVRLSGKAAAADDTSPFSMCSASVPPSGVLSQTTQNGAPTSTRPRR
jgi:hypothetical protein